MGRNKSGGEEERLVPAESGLGPGSGKTDLAPPIPYHSYLLYSHSVFYTLPASPGGSCFCFRLGHCRGLDLRYSI